jgi:hypothetical protein
MKAIVGTTPTQLPVGDRQVPVIQNLGPGVVYIGFTSDVSADSGLRIPVDAVYEFPGNVQGTLHAVSTLADTDVRVLVVA